MSQGARPSSHRHRRRNARWPLLGLGVAGAAIAVAAAVGIGQAVGSPACALELPAAVQAGTALRAGTAVQAGTVSGTATYYKSPPGNCSYPSPPADGLYVALSPSEYASAAACGGYLEVHGPDGSVRVEVVDQCPECAAGHIDLSAAAFAKIAPVSAGQVSVSYTHLANPAVPGPLGLRVKEGSSRYWLALLATNTGNPLASVAVRSPSGGWHDLARADYNYWIAASGVGDGPFTVRLTDTAGHQVTVGGIALSPGVVQGTGTYMYGAGSAPPATTQVTTRASASPSASRATPAAAATGSRHRPRPTASPRTSPVTVIPGSQPATPVLAATAIPHC
jgi:expansin (peptidoglycan-binding protein)